MTPAPSIPSVSDRAGWTLPAIGLGTYRLTGSAGARSVATALDAGYRLVDSAAGYENEGAVGAGVRQSGVPREEVIVTSKLLGRHHRHDEAIAAAEESLFRTGLDALDLYLIHWPNPQVGLYVEAWTALIELKERGVVREIGVCNFLPDHLDRLAAETGVTPAVNQIELHPYFPQAEARAYHEEHGIITESWSPIGRGNDVTEQPVVQEVARAHGVTPVQAVLRWHVELGAVPLPKAAGLDRQRENLDISGFALAADEVDAISGLARDDGRLADQDPAVYEEL